MRELDRCVKAWIFLPFFQLLNKLLRYTDFCCSQGNPNSQGQETLDRRPGMRILFDAAKDAPDEVLQKTADLLEAMKNGQVK